MNKIPEHDSFASQESNPDMKVRPIGIVAFDGVEILDLTGPMEVFAIPNDFFQRAGLAKGPVYPIRVFAKQPGPVIASCGLQIHADSAYGELDEDIDTLLIPGSPNVHTLMSDPKLLDWVAAMSTRVRRLVSVCTGAFLLAEAGLLNGKRATTHWAFCDRLAVNYPEITVEPDRIFLRDGPILTSGGVTSGIDLALSLVEEDWGQEQALQTARYLVVFLKRPGGQSQFSAFLISKATNHQDLRELQVWIMEHPAEDLRVETLAERMSMSPRNFARVFQAETGMTPAKFVEKARIDTARHFLEASSDPIESVAVAAGFGDAARLRKVFVRNLGITPREFRERFSRQDTQPLPIMTGGRDGTIKTSLNKF